VARLSVITVAYNSVEMIGECIRSVLAESARIDLEMIVVDNASQDGTPDLIRRSFPDAKLVAQPENRGFAAGNNAGIAAASGEIFILLNPDTIVQPGALDNMARFLADHSQVGIAGPRVRDGQGHALLTAYPEYQPGMVLWQFVGLDRILPYQVYGRYRAACERSTQPFTAAWLNGSCLAIRREVVDQIGGLDEDFFLFSEETDFCERAARAGWEIYLVPQAEIIHYESSGVSRYTAIKVRHHHRSALHYFRKRGREGAVRVLKAGFALELVMKIVIRLLEIMFARRNQAYLKIETYRAVLREVWRY